MTTKKVNNLNIIKCIGLAAVIAATMVTPSDSHAGFMVTIGDATVVPGASGYLDVFVHSTDGMSGDSFQYYFLDFLVYGNAQSAEPINFVVSVIPAPQLLSTNPNYIFRDNSAMAADLVGVDFVARSSVSSTAYDLINVMDWTDDFEGRTIFASDGKFLLARLNFLAPLVSTSVDPYKVSLDFGLFEDEDGAPVDFEFTPGSITIGAAAAVPEPSSIVLMAIGSLITSFVRWRRKSILPCPI